MKREIEMLVNFSNRVSPSLAQMVNLYFCLVFSATNHCHKKPYHFILPLSKTVQILSKIKENFRNVMLTLSNSVPNSKKNLNLLMVSSPLLILSSPLLRVRTVISK